MLASIQLPSTVIKIRESAFYGCAGLDELVLPSGLLTIKHGAFENCTGLTEFVIPASVTNIGKEAFRWCTSLWHVLHRGTEAQWNAMNISSGNEYLYDAVRHHNCDGNEIWDLENKQCLGCCEHNYEISASADATCVAEGYVQYTCPLCGDTYMETIPALPHTPGPEATCTEDQTCTVCGAVLMAASGHIEADPVIEQDVKPTCTADGSYDTVIYCAKCSIEMHRQTTTVPANGHRNVDGDHLCDVCGEVLSTCEDGNGDDICDGCGGAMYVLGSMDGDEDVDSDDAIYLLYHTFLPEEYPLDQNGDMDGDGDVDSDDAIYLLYHTFLPDEYPLHN
jgi:hypothetical protein